ncbi:hypothetical protein ACFOJF_00580 [Pseudocitrobacter faecalis]
MLRPERWLIGIAGLLLLGERRGVPATTCIHPTERLDATADITYRPLAERDAATGGAERWR